MWKYYAILSAFFAAMTAILTKVGVKDICQPESHHRRSAYHRREHRDYDGVKQAFYFVLSSICRLFPAGEDRRHLNNKHEKASFLFCIVFDLHYLCSVKTKIWKTRRY